MQQSLPESINASWGKASLLVLIEEVDFKIGRQSYLLKG